MTAKTQDGPTTKVITPLAILSYPWLAEPQKGKAGKADKYSATLVISPALLALPGEQARYDAMKAAAMAAGNKKFGDQFVKLAKGEGFKIGFRKDWEAKEYPENSVFVNARSNTQPGFVFAYAGADGKPAVVPAADVKKVFYAGAIVRASLNAFGFDTEGNKGISWGLNNIQFVRDGERLDNRAAANDEFNVELSEAPDSGLDGLL